MSPSVVVSLSINLVNARVYGVLVFKNKTKNESKMIKNESMTCLKTVSYLRLVMYIEFPNNGSVRLTSLYIDTYQA